MIARAAVLLLCATSALARINVPEWMKAAAAEPQQEYSEKTRGVVLLDERIVNISPSGEVRTTTRRVMRIVSTSGRDLAMVGVPIDSEMRLIGLRGWSIGADGQQYQVAERDATEMSAYTGELYADDKMKLLRLPSSEPGSVVGYEFEHVERPYGLQDLWFFQSELPVVRARYTLTLPQGWSYDVRWIRRDVAEPRQSGSTSVWELANVPAVEEEPVAPSVIALSGRMGVTFLPPTGLSAHRTWNDVARWYESLAVPRAVVTPAVDQKARALTANAASKYEKVAALARFTQRDVRYVAIEIGIGAYQPHAADAVLSTLYGDCKDKVTLLASLLRAVGIESRPVLVNSSRGVVDDRFPSRLGFNHVIIAIPLPGDAPKDLPAVKEGTLYFDPTNANTPLGLLPVYLQDNRGLVVSGDARELTELPLHPPHAARLARSAKLVLTADGTLSGAFDEVRTGEIAARYRYAVASLNENERRNFVAGALAFNLDGHALSDLVFEHLDDPSKELIVRYRITAPMYARKAGGMLLVRPRVIGRKAESIVDLTDRRHDYLTDGPSQQTDDVEIAVPAGLTVEELPPARKFTTPVISYTSESTFEGGTLHYKRMYEVHRVQVAHDEIAALNKAFGEILADERAAAILK